MEVVNLSTPLAPVLQPLSLALMVSGAVALTRTEAGASKVVTSLPPPPQVPLRALDERLREQGG